MTLTINTNVASIIAQRNLNNATSNLNKSLERLTTGFKINHSSDNAADYSISDQWVTKLGSLDVAADNASIGVDMLTTAEENYGLLASHLQRIRDLTEQAANGTYASASLRAIQAEIYGRLQEIDRIAANSEFNGVKLMLFNDSDDSKNKGIGMHKEGVNLQVGLYNDNDSVINLNIDLFKSAKISGLFSGGEVTIYGRDAKGDTTKVTKTLDEVLQAAGGSVAALNTQDGLRAFAAACSALKYTPATGTGAGEGTYTLLSDETNNYGASAMIGFIDNAIDELTKRATKIGASQNRLTSAIDAIDIQSQNLTSSLSTLRDTDVASESSKYVQSQILQQASATLLATANQSPSIALNLI